MLLSRWWANWRRSLIIVQPATVPRWRRRGFWAIWVSGSCGRWRGGRPKISSEVRALIVQMSQENFLWGAPQIHGELLKLGFDVSQATGARGREPRHEFRLEPDRLVEIRDRPVSLLKTVNYRKSLGIFQCDRRTVGRDDHHSVCSRFGVLVPVSQPSVAGTRTCRPATSADRLGAATPSPPPPSFRRLAPVGGTRVLDTLVLVKSATVVEWHRQSFRIYWRWRSRYPGRPRTSAEIRALIRQMSRANPLWGAPRIHGELLKLGIEVCRPVPPTAP